MTNKQIIKSSETPVSNLAAAFLVKKIDYVSREIGPVKIKLNNDFNQMGTRIILDIGMDDYGKIHYQCGNGQWETLNDNDEIFYISPVDCDF